MNFNLSVKPVRFFTAILFGDHLKLENASQKLQDYFGEIDFIGHNHAFDLTDYYREEMGDGLLRSIVSFSQLQPPDRLVDAKLTCIKIEQELAQDNRRTANIDIGYLDHHKIVLASTKAAGQKIYLSQGIYGDLTARYKWGRYQPFEWTFPDFKDGRYDQEFLTLRSML